MSWEEDDQTMLDWVNSIHIVDPETGEEFTEIDDGTDDLYDDE